MITTILSVLFAAVDPMDSAPTITSVDNAEFFVIYPNELADESFGHIPGSKETYSELLFRHGQKWNAYSVFDESVITTNASIGPYLCGSSAYGLRYDIRSVLTDNGLTPSELTNGYIDWYPSLFDFVEYSTKTVGGNSWWVRFAAKGDGELKSLSQIYPDGTKLYQTKAMRLDAKGYKALSSSYEAYFERLYYASEGQTNKWNTEDFGTTIKGPMFPFNISSGSYLANVYFDVDHMDGARYIGKSRRLLEYDNLFNLRSKCKYNLVSSPAKATSTPPVNGSFIYRPGWILDYNSNPDPSHDAEVWWASSFYPPIVDIPEAMDDPGIWQMPSIDGFGSFPHFGWTETPVAHMKDGHLEQNFDWPTKCVTLEMANSVSCENPCRVLFECVGYDASAQLDRFVRPYAFSSIDGNNLQRWMTNAFPLAVSQLKRQSNAFNDYLSKCWGTPSHRVSSYDFVGCNHLLAAMDRTYHIPSMRIVSSNEQVNVEIESGYKSGSIEFTFSVDPFTYEVTIDSESDHGIVDLSKTFTSNTITSYALDLHEDYNITTSIPNFDFGGILCKGSGEGYSAIGSTTLIPFSEPGDNEMTIESFYPGEFEPGIEVRAYLGTNLVNFGVYPSYASTDRDVILYAAANRSYFYTHPASHNLLLGPTQPGRTGSGRCFNASGTCLDRFTMTLSDISGTEVTNGTWYHSGNLGNFNSRSSLVNRINLYASGVDERIATLSSSINGGYSYLDPSTYAATPNNIASRYSIGAQLSNWTATPSPAVFERTYTNSVSYTFDTYTNVVEFSLITNVYIECNKTHNYDLSVKFYQASGAVVSNLVDLGVEIDPIGVTIGSEDSQFIGSTNIPCRWTSGPHQQLLESVSVPIFGELVENVFKLIWTDGHLYDHYDVTKKIMSGSGPSDQGTEISTEYESYEKYNGDKREKGSHEYIGTNVRKTAPYYTVRPTSEAEQIGGEPFTVYGYYHIFWKKVDEQLSDFRTKIIYDDPAHGIYDQVDDVFPLQIGSIRYELDITPDFSDPPDPGGCKFGITDTTGGFKVMTQVDWNWKNLRTR